MNPNIQLEILSPNVRQLIVAFEKTGVGPAVRLSDDRRVELEKRAEEQVEGKVATNEERALGITDILDSMAADVQLKAGTDEYRPALAQLHAIVTVELTRTVPDGEPIGLIDPRFLETARRAIEFVDAHHRHDVVKEKMFRLARAKAESGVAAEVETAEQFRLDFVKKAKDLRMWASQQVVAIRGHQGKPNLARHANPRPIAPRRINPVLTDQQVEEARRRADAEIADVEGSVEEVAPTTADVSGFGDPARSVDRV